MYGLYGLIHGVYVGNLIRIGSELAGISDMALFAGFQAFFSGLGGMIGPPVKVLWVPLQVYIFDLYNTSERMSFSPR